MRVAAGTEEATAEALSVVALVTPHESLETQHGAYLVLVTPVVGEDLLVLIDNKVEQHTLLLFRDMGHQFYFSTFILYGSTFDQT